MIQANDSFLSQFVALLQSFSNSTLNDDVLQQALKQIGWAPDAIAELPLALENSEVDNTYQELQWRLLKVQQATEPLLQYIEQPPTSYEDTLKVLKEIQKFLDLLSKAFDGIIDTTVLDNPDAWNQIGEDLLSFFGNAYIQINYPVFYSISELLTLTIAPEDQTPTEIIKSDTGEIVRVAVAWPQFRFSHIQRLLSDPVKLLKETYLNKDGNLDLEHSSQRIFSRLYRLVVEMGLTARYGLKPFQREAFGDSVNLAEQMFTVYLNGDQSGPSITLSLSTAEEGDLGLVVLPAGFGQVPQKVELEDWDLTFSYQFDTNGPDPESFAFGADGPTVFPLESNPHIGLIAKKKPGIFNLAFLLGDELGTHIEAEGLQIEVNAAINNGTQTYSLQCTLEKGHLDIEELIRFEWDKLQIRFEGGSTVPKLNVEGFRIYTPVGDEEPILNFDPTFDLNDLQVTRNSLALRIKGTSLDDWLRMAAPNLSQDPSSTDNSQKQDITVRVLFGSDGGIGLDELRIEWGPVTTQSFNLPGINVALPEVAFYSVILGGKNREIDQVAFIATLAKDKEVSVTSSFAWDRPGPGEGSNDRELQNDVEKPEEVFKLTLQTPNQKTNIVLVDFPIESNRLPKFFQQADEFKQLSLSDSAATDLTLSSIKLSRWNPTFKLTDTLSLPFLNSDSSGQHIEVKEFDGEGIQINDTGIAFPLGVIIHITETLKLETTIDVSVGLTTFALNMEVADLVLKSDKEQLTGNFLGLKWRFIPNNKKEYFILTTKDFDYRIKQAENAKLELEYGLLGEDPIIFVVESFEINEAGVSLKATVSDRPAKLNGLDTKFRFKDSSFEIVDNHIKGFTLAGTGPVPPSLLGDGIASIALQFEPESTGGALKLISGAAEIKGDQMLECKGTGFRFEVNAIGLKFVDDGQYHLYFTISGKARFNPSADSTGPLSLLSKVELELVDCPITGDVSVLAEHIDFLVALPKPVDFDFLGCFNMELRAIGFEPQSKVFDGDGAMKLTGLMTFADGDGDSKPSAIDYHTLYVGLPEQGSFIPRIHFDTLPLSINLGEAFKLSGSVEQVKEDDKEGFEGQGVLTIQGLPQTAASFAFMRVRRDEDGRWVRAWFLFLEVRQVSFPIPVVQLYMREVGLGFGYRYTLTSIKAADRANDVSQLIRELKKLSRTQGSLATRQAWEVDAEGNDPRWTVAMRAMLSQTSAAASPLNWQDDKEKELANAFLFDAVIALRSDFTFLMVVRAWMNTNYHYFFHNRAKIENNPLFSGFVLLTPREKRMLAHLASNPDGFMGESPKLPEILEKALKNGQFSATLLVEPGLVHYELGWPNQLRWSGDIGEMKAEFRGGYIIRVSRDHFVIGNSFEARGTMAVGLKADLGFVGAEVAVNTDVAFGARYIGMVPIETPLDYAFYGAIAIDATVDVQISAWVKITISVKVFGKRYRKSWQKTYRLSASVDFTAGLEVGILRNGTGLRGHGALAISALGHSIEMSARLDVDKESVKIAQERTDDFMAIGLEANDAEALSESDSAISVENSAAVNHVAMDVAQPIQITQDDAVGNDAAVAPEGVEQGPAGAVGLAADDNSGVQQKVSKEDQFDQPAYIIFVIRKPNKDQGSNRGEVFFVLLPKGEGEVGFLPPPPYPKITGEGENETVTYNSEDLNDFTLTISSSISDATIKQWTPPQSNGEKEGFKEVKKTWRANWDAVIESKEGISITDEKGVHTDPIVVEIKLGEYLTQAFITKDDYLCDFRLVTVNSDDELQKIVEEFESEFDPDRGECTLLVVHLTSDPDKWTLVGFNKEGSFKSALTDDDNSELIAALNKGPANKREIIGLVTSELGHQLGEWTVSAGDPDHPSVDDEVIKDKRVHNPTDGNYEAAVRGAVAQFQGSPFFKTDPKNNGYDKQLLMAFETGNERSIYYNNKEANDLKKVAEDGVEADIEKDNLTDDQAKELREITDKNLQEEISIKSGQRQQARQMRGSIIQDMVADLRDFVDFDDSDKTDITERSLAFQMGLVFRVEDLPDEVDEWPAWLRVAEHADEKDHLGGEEPKTTFQIQQRVKPDEPKISDEKRAVTLFNTLVASFAKKPPNFDNATHFSCASTIAIAWDLRWPTPPEGHCTKCQQDPEHHLMHYEIRRRVLGSQAQEKVFTRRSADVLNRGENGKLQLIKSRFGLVDHFSEESLEEQAALPLDGITYLYTITPVDFEGGRGLPLTRVITRNSDQPAPTPTNAELTVSYLLEQSDFKEPDFPPQLIPKTKLELELNWDKPYAESDGPEIAIETYRLVFRPVATLPIGSYGRDGVTEAAGVKALPASNAIPRQDDVVISFSTTSPGSVQGQYAHTITHTELPAILFPEDNMWQPNAWRVLIQAVSDRNVPSALAPVKVTLKTELNQGNKIRRDERQVAELEWLPRPISLPILPSQDGKCKKGYAHIPMPKKNVPGAENDTPISVLKQLGFKRHPAATRCIRFLWNQGASNSEQYPLEINAGFQLLQLDIDAHTTDTFKDERRLNQALKPIQEIQMFSATDQRLNPSDTLATSQWEAWYPSTSERIEAPDGCVHEGAKQTMTPWYSWRESVLIWPPALKQLQANSQIARIHPFLDAFIQKLEQFNPEKPNKNLPYTVDLQTTPPIKQGDLAAFMSATAPSVDPYGWAVLQYFGLSITFALRDNLRGNKLVTGKDEALITKVQTAIDQAFEENKDNKEWQSLKSHLHLELLFQPNKSVELGVSDDVDANRMLGIIQLSLRPIAQQSLEYARLDISGVAGSELNLVFKTREQQTLIVQTGATEGETVELEANKSYEQNVVLPINGLVILLLRGKNVQNTIIEPWYAIKSTPDLSTLDSEAQKIFEDLFPQDKSHEGFLKVTQSTDLFSEDRKASMVKPFQHPDDQRILKLCFRTCSAGKPGQEKDIQPKGPFKPKSFNLTDKECVGHLSIYFTAPTDLLLADFLTEAKKVGSSWKEFKGYAEKLNGEEKQIDGKEELRIQVPNTKGTLKPLLSDYLLWSQRFFDHGSSAIGKIDVVSTPNPPLFVVASAYPKNAGIAYVSPDAAGRLRYEHLIEDDWAHNYRYYIRPEGRYDLLWNSFRIALQPEDENKTAQLAQPDPELGGLDVVLERTHPVDPPLVIHSTLIKPLVSELKSEERIWEVAIARHPEQALIESNSTMQRQLGFRSNPVHALVRQFSYELWKEQFFSNDSNAKRGEPGEKLKVDSVGSHYPGLPDQFPGAEERGEVDPHAHGLAVALPTRFANFQQGATVLQWRALPFYYHHQLLLKARTDSLESQIIRIEQRDFHYRAPPPHVFATLPNPTTGKRIIWLRLERFWDCLSVEGQKAWPTEKPDEKQNPIKESALPDPEMVYQLVENFSGNIEVQFQIASNQAKSIDSIDPKDSLFEIKRVGRRFKKPTKKCVIREEKVSEENELQPKVDEFKSEFSTKIEECVILIVQSTSPTPRWKIAGYDDKGNFKSGFVEDNKLLLELEKDPVDKDKIVELVTSWLDRTLSPELHQIGFRFWLKMIIEPEVNQKKSGLVQKLSVRTLRGNATPSEPEPLTEPPKGFEQQVDDKPADLKNTIGEGDDNTTE